MDFRAWWGSGFGAPLPEELVEARRGVDLAGRRAARRAVRRGEAATDAPIARLAVAEARHRQRALGGATISLMAGLTVVLVGIAVARVAGRHWDGALWSVLGAYGVYATVAGLRALDRAPKAELHNLERLRELGQTYDLGTAEPADLPLVAQVTAALAAFVVIDLAYGLLSRGLDGKRVTLASVVAHGAFFAVAFVAFAAWLGRSGARKRARRPTAGDAQMPPR
jgi:hypothetical protein